MTCWVAAKDQPVVEDVVFGDPMRGVMGERRVFEQDTRLQPRPLLLPNPGQFKFLLSRHDQEIIRAAMVLEAMRAAVVGVG